jgi:hypothetical protein
MRILIVAAALLATLAQAQPRPATPVWPRVYVERSLQWKGGTAAPPGDLGTSATLLYFFEDHRYIAVGLYMIKGKVRNTTPMILENESHSVRSGTWQQEGEILRLHSAFTHLDALIKPYPAPADEQFVSVRKNWLVEGGSLKVAADAPKSGRPSLPSVGTIFVPVGEIVGIKDMQHAATSASCYYFKSHPQDANEVWNAVCKSSTGK